MKASKAGAPALSWSELRDKLLVHHQPFYENTSKIWLGSTTILAVEDDGPRCPRRVDDTKVKKELTVCQQRALVDGDEWWCRWVASNGGVDGWRRWWTGGRGSPSQWLLALCLNSLHDVSGFCPFVSLCDSLLRILLDSFGQLLVSFFFAVFVQFFVIVGYIVTVTLTAELWCR